MFSRHLIETATLGPSCLELTVRLNWYRALPLSCVERLELSLDGNPLDPARTRVDVAGLQLRPAELTDHDDTWWRVPDSGRLTVELDAPPEDGEHLVELLIGTRIPYLVDPAGNAVVIVDRTRAAVHR
jgi:hypothetical protein